MTLTQTCRTFGYPFQYVLRKWIQPFCQKARPCISEKTLVRYSQGQKLAVAGAMLVGGILDYKDGLCKWTQPR